MPGSYLFVPGNRPDFFGKAHSSDASAVILDLEDAVPVCRKEEARQTVASWLSPDRPAYVRVNEPASPWFERDVEEVLRPGLAGIVLPKAEDPGEVSGVAARLLEPRVVPIVETALGLWRAHEVAGSPGVERLAFGSIDFQLDVGASGEREELLYARSRLVVISRIAGILPPLDSVTSTLHDPKQLAEDVRRARRLGFGGKLCIHPQQVEEVNRGFAPAAAEISWAEKVVRAAQTAEEGVVMVDGEMIDRPVVERAKRILELAGRPDV